MSNTKPIAVSDITGLGYPNPSSLQELGTHEARIDALEANNSNSAISASESAASAANSATNAQNSANSAANSKTSVDAAKALIDTAKSQVDAAKMAVDSVKAQVLNDATNAAAAAILAQSHADAASAANTSVQFAKNQVQSSEANAAASAAQALAIKNDVNTGLAAQLIQINQFNLMLSGFNATNGAVKSAVDGVSGRVANLENDHIGITSFNNLSAQINGNGGILSRVTITEGQITNLSNNKADTTYINSQIASVNNAIGGKVSQSAYDLFVANQVTTNSANVTKFENLSAGLANIAQRTNNLFFTDYEYGLIGSWDINSSNGWAALDLENSANISYQKNIPGQWVGPFASAYCVAIGIRTVAGRMGITGVGDNLMPVTPNDWVISSAYLSLHRGDFLGMELAVFNANKTHIGYIGYTLFNNFLNIGGNTGKLDNDLRRFIKVQIPNSVNGDTPAFVAPWNWGHWPVNANSPYFFQVAPMLEKVSAIQNAPSLYQSGSASPNSRLNSISASVNQNSGAIAAIEGAAAYWNLEVAASGSTPALMSARAGNNGSSFDFISQVFRIWNQTKTGVIEVLKAVGGYVFFSNPISIDVGSKRLTLGANSAHVLWFGANTIDPPFQTLANSTFALGTDGKLYFGGNDKITTSWLAPNVATENYLNEIGFFHTASGNQNTWVEIYNRTITTNGGFVEIDAYLTLKGEQEVNASALNSGVKILMDGNVLRNVDDITVADTNNLGSPRFRKITPNIAWAHIPPAGNHTYSVQVKMTETSSKSSYLESGLIKITEAKR